jgi:hypothetical protein
LAAIWEPTPTPWPTLVTRHSKDELLQLSEARATLAASDRAERYRPRNLLLAAGGLLAAATCTVGGAYAWLTERSALDIPQDAAPKPLPPHAPTDPHLVANMTVKPLGEGIRAMVALTGEIGLGVGAAAVVGATAVAMAIRKGHRGRREAEIAALAADAQAAEAADDEQLPQSGHEADNTEPQRTLTDELMSFRPKTKRHWRERLARTARLAMGLRGTPMAPELADGTAQQVDDASALPAALTKLAYSASPFAE